MRKSFLLRIKLPGILFLVLPFFFAFSSCQEEVDIEMKNANPVLVIEGSLNDLVENQVVKISKTIPFSDKNMFNGFSGADVILRTEGGHDIRFLEYEPGIYLSHEFAGIPGQRYQLDVRAEGKLYSASSVMPQRVVLDSITFEKLSFLGNTNIYPVANYKDPVGIQNQYFFILKMNNKVVENIVTEDRFNNGNDISDILLYELEDFKSGDSLEVDLQSIDRNVFKYYYAINQISGQNGPPVAPANPASNFNNGALGVFNAHTSSKVKVIFK